MITTTFLTGTLAACLLTTPVQVPATGTQPVAESKQYRAKQILGTSISLQGSATAGVLDDLVFDEAGNLEYIIVNNGGKLTTVPWEAAKFDLDKKSATLSVTQQQFNAVPTYTTESYPTFYAPAYRTQIYRSYGLIPRQLRRLERRLP